jgi:hypothetical protein
VLRDHLFSLSRRRPSPIFRHRRFFVRMALRFKHFGVIGVMSRAERGQRKPIMTTFTITEQNNITAFASPEEAAAATTTPFDSFSTEQELTDLIAGWPAERLLAVWNSLPGVKPVTKFKEAKTAASRIWPRIQSLGESVEPKLEQPVKPKTEKKAKVSAPAAKGAPAKGKANKKAPAAKNAPKAKKGAKTVEATEPREGSKMSQVVAMLQRENGATLVEIMDKMGWQRHTVRGLVAGALKKAGYSVESFKPEGGERTYRIK